MQLAYAIVTVLLIIGTGLSVVVTVSPEFQTIAQLLETLT